MIYRIPREDANKFYPLALLGVRVSINPALAKVIQKVINQEN
jgi:hypothetical protein